MSKRKYALSKAETGTILRYDLADDLAYIYTADKALVRRLALIAQIYPSMIETKKDEYSHWYVCPRSWIRIVPPRLLTDEKRAELRARAKRNFRTEQQGDER